VPEFVTVAKTSDIPPQSGKSVEVNGTAIAVFNIAGEFYAIRDTCPHAGGPLGEGDVLGAAVTCPWHAWTFDVRTGKCQTLPTASVPCYAVQVVGEEIKVGLEP
jgi:nitrite reductase (NADH) small subunit